eukprot:4057539-Amphidinium_carterae.1
MQKTDCKAKTTVPMGQMLLRKTCHSNNEPYQMTPSLSPCALLVAAFKAAASAVCCDVRVARPHKTL